MTPAAMPPPETSEEDEGFLASGVSVGTGVGVGVGLGVDVVDVVGVEEEVGVLEVDGGTEESEDVDDGAEESVEDVDGADDSVGVVLETESEIEVGALLSIVLVSGVDVRVAICGSEARVPGVGVGTGVIAAWVVCWVWCPCGVVCSAGDATG